MRIGKMKAIEFSNQYTKAVNIFFARCLEYEPVPLHKIQDITISFTDRGFSLRLETVDNDFSQEFDVDEKEIIPLYFETH